MKIRAELHQALLSHGFMKRAAPLFHASQEMLIRRFQRTADEPRLNDNAQYDVLVVITRGWS